MKKNIFIVWVLAISIQSFSQGIKSPSTFTQDDYLKKSKNQKKAAWILLIGGTALTGIGTIILSKNVAYDIVSIFSTDQPKQSYAGGEILFYTGCASMIASIPLFIISAKNKKKALSATSFFKMEAVPLIQNKSFAYKSYPALSVKINL